MTWNCYLYSFTIQDQFWTFKIYPPYHIIAPSVCIHLPSKTSSGHLKYIPHIIAASVGDIIPPQSEEELTFRDPRTILEMNI